MYSFLFKKEKNTFQVRYLDDAPDVHLCDHLGSVEEHEQGVQGEGDILQWGIVLERLGCVHAHGDDTDYGAGPQQRVHPLRKITHFNMSTRHQPAAITQTWTIYVLPLVLKTSGVQHCPVWETIHSLLC